MRSLLKTIVRELEIIAHRPILWIATLGVPIFTAFFVATVFGSGTMRGLPIGVTDNDFSSVSRSLIRTIDSSPTLSITHHFTNSEEALAAMRAREIYGYVVIPQGLASDMTRGTRATIPYYYHYAFLSVGGEIESTLRTILTMASIAPIATTAQQMGIADQRITTFLEPISGDMRPIGNPTLNYHTYLSEPFFFIMFQIVILLTVVYVVGWDIDRGCGKEWLSVAGGDIFVALMGKLLPYILTFIVSGIAALYIIYGIESEVWQGTLGWLVVAMVGLVVASVSLALFIYSLFPAMGLIISVVSMVGSLGATLSGITFPIASMYSLFHGVALALPIRHFSLIVQNQFYAEGGFGYVWWHAAALVIFCLLPLFTMRHLQRAIIFRKYDKFA